jgi:hypothetical protein
VSTISRHALRVYAALEGLAGHNEDILDALVPFFEPVLSVMNRKLLEPQLLATGMRKLYGWRINRDVAEQFIPRLLRKGYLRRAGTRGTAAYVVEYEAPPEHRNVATISDVLRQIIDEFEAFPARITDLLHYERTREELTDVLILFLVSLDAYGEAAFAAEVSRVGKEEQIVLEQLPEGGRTISHDDRYMCARFVKHLYDNRPNFVPHLARLASIGLLTEVVEDFVKPTVPASKVNLANHSSRWSGGARLPRVLRKRFQGRRQAHTRGAEGDRL